MHPELFTFFSYHVYAYSFFMTLAAVTVVVGSFWLARKRGMYGKKVLIILLVMLAGAFIGARLLNILINRELYLNDPGLVYSLDSRGFSLFGGGITAVLLGMILSFIFKINLWKLGDAIAPFLGLGVALMRLGCFLNGCCFGKVTDLFWGVRFPVLSQAHIYQISNGQAELLSVAPVHPTQLYELLAAIAASVIAVYMMKKNYPEGSAILSFIIFFAAFRWINYSFFRVMPQTFDAPGYFYPLFYAVIIVICSSLLAMKMKRQES